MKNISIRSHRPFRASKLRTLCLLLTSGAALSPAASYALEFDLGESGAKLNWDTTVKYSNAFRLKDPSSVLLDQANGGLNQDDGNRNFKKGLISNRFDIFTEADIKKGDFGARLSAAAWYDTVYNKGNHNDSPGTNNSPAGVAFDQFTPEAQRLAGQKGELLDAFVFGKLNLGQAPLTFRAGRHTLYWGETFFFSNNGIAGTMGPVDALKGQSVPSTASKEIFRPVGQLSGQVQLNADTAVGAYYQYKWERTRLAPSGHFFSQGDILDAGGSCLRFVAGPPCNFPFVAATRTADQEAKNSGQYGLQLKFKDADRGVDYGVYYTVSHSKTPNVYITNLAPVPNAPPGTFVPTGYNLAYHENIKSLGVSTSFTSGPVQWAGEISTRRNTPLAADGVVVAFTNADNAANALYPIGNTLHANVSALATLPPNFLARTSALTAELAWNRALNVTKNANNLSRDANGNLITTRDALAMRVLFTPTYTQVFDGVDIDVPVGLGYVLAGRSRAVPGFGGKGTGDFSIGLQGTYRTVWKFSVNYTRYFGNAGNSTNAQGNSTFLQSLRDRDNISFSVSTTF